MKYEIGKQYSPDDHFKSKARLHQSVYRSKVLKVDYDEYGNRLTDENGRKYLNYYDGLNVIAELKKRYPNYSKKRDADMLRSEHIPFNLLAPLKTNKHLAKSVIRKAFDIQCSTILDLKLEFAPEPKENYLNDATAFDTYIEYLNISGERCGIGIEVKYTEQAYRIGKSEKIRVKDNNSTYWKTTRKSRAFLDSGDQRLGEDVIRQIWRNHILGLSMLQAGDLARFHSITLYPQGNVHIEKAIHQYQSLLTEDYRDLVFGCTFETYITAIDGAMEITRWKEYLKRRYLIAT